MVSEHTRSWDLRLAESIGFETYTHFHPSNSTLQEQVAAVPASYKIDIDHKLVLSTVWGRFTFADALTHKDRLLSDPDFRPTYSQIVDFTHVSEIALSGEEIRRFAEFDVFAPESRRAFVAPDDEKFGLSRMFAMLRENRGETGIEVFRNLDDALEWVLNKDEWTAG